MKFVITKMKYHFNENLLLSNQLYDSKYIFIKYCYISHSYLLIDINSCVLFHVSSNNK